MKTLGDLSARFVRKEQFDALDEYIRKITNRVEKEGLQAASKKQRKLLDWDRKRLIELTEFFKGSTIPINN